MFLNLRIDGMLNYVDRVWTNVLHTRKNSGHFRRASRKCILEEIILRPVDKFNMILFLFLLSGEGDTLKGKKGGKLCSLKVAHILSRLCQASHKRDTSKQYKP